MRILFAPLPRASHLYFVAPLAWACRAAGHEVRIAAPPDLTEAVVRAGLTPAEIGAGPHPATPAAPTPPGGRPATPGLLAEASDDERRRLLDLRFAPLVDTAVRTAPDLVRFAEYWRPQLVVADPMAFAAPLVAAARDIPLLRHLTGPDIMHRTHNPMHGPTTGDEYTPNWPTGLAELFTKFGAAVRDDYASGSIDPWPGSVQVPDAPARIPVRFVSYDGAAAAPDRTPEPSGRPQVCVSWGERGEPDGGVGEAPVLTRVLDALAARDVDVVLTGSGIDRVRHRPLPDRIRLADGLPLHALVPDCEAVISEGGTNTILTAASLGVPQVLLPLVERPPNAANFCESGAGITLSGTEAGTEAIGAAVDSALADDGIRAAARKMRDEIAAAPSPADLVRTLEQLA
ncbi:nucleotide disphospho-sugar-binding domain-containing protein [Kitasatospora sp. NPDC028055]|uniref:nucleotide disphospho-sugar-binding domain-containing protein n=1 Tax=Kitasatospora sp. NPDC028055 TaxID=3155653 RepID=UPI0033D61290